MSASREKQLRQEQIGQPDPKTAREAQQTGKRLQTAKQTPDRQSRILCVGLRM